MSWCSCKVCREKDERIEYLQKLVDNLLISNNLPTIVNNELEENYEEAEMTEAGIEIIG